MRFTEPATTRDAAHAASGGNAPRVDIFVPIITRAIDLATAEGVHNVRFEQGDA